jgi:hypothetical protein
MKRNLRFTQEEADGGHEVNLGRQPVFPGRGMMAPCLFTGSPQPGSVR